MIKTVIFLSSNETKVIKPELFGVAKTSKAGKITTIKEKPKRYFSDLASTGLYFFDNNILQACECISVISSHTKAVLKVQNMAKIF